MNGPSSQHNGAVSAMLNNPTPTPLAAAQTFYGQAGFVWAAPVVQSDEDGATRIGVGFPIGSPTYPVGGNPVLALHGEANSAEAAIAGLLTLGAVSVPLLEAAHAVLTHASAWECLLSALVNVLPPDGPPGSGEADRSYAEHELAAMRRDLGALRVAFEAMSKATR